ncbi:ring-cleaving dioxygenase [Lysinibacillus sp. B2A1]|nr:ring-cleaving dioxygenase [Lysinibacillus sp. B2A1]
MNHLKGIHHVTAITSSAEENYKFFTFVLGMRLVKKTVNQDDIQTYHLFFADDKGSAGTDMTFFDFPNIPKGEHGTNEISKTSFRVPTDAALDYWLKRFDRLQVNHTGIKEQFGKKTLSFVDFDDQQYQLISDEHNKGVASGTPWQDGPIPLEYAITGLGPHHAAFRVEDRAVLNEWTERFESFGFHTSGYVNRHFFESLYARVAPQILFELATDGPGFMGDEPYETLGEKLSLPPFLEPKRAQIEELVRPIDTVRSTIKFDKEYE